VGDDSGGQGDGEANDGLEGALSQEGADRGWQHEIAEQKGHRGEEDQAEAVVAPGRQLGAFGSMIHRMTSAAREMPER
jgi:hypothetical protein